jgi:protein involved in polysaccharide export with SLBB domain
MKIFDCLKVLSILLLLPVLSACFSTKDSASDYSAGVTIQSSPSAPSSSAEAELKMLKEQSTKIIESVKKEQTKGDNQTFSPNDQLIIQVWLHDRTTQFKGYPFQQVIPPSGEVFIPDVGAVVASGKTVSELKSLITTHFTKTLREPTIMVERIRKIESVISTTTGWSQTADRQAAQLIPHIIVMGWVGAPGIYPLEPGLTVREALALSGKLDENGDYKKIYLVRGSVRNPTVTRINLNKILRGDDLSKNYVLQPNDAIYVAPVKMWTAYDYIRTALLPISAVRDAVWVGTSAAIK